jgi:hypothetical protein
MRRLCTVECFEIVVYMKAGKPRLDGNTQVMAGVVTCMEGVGRFWSDGH